MASKVPPRPNFEAYTRWPAFIGWYDGNGAQVQVVTEHGDYPLDPGLEHVNHSPDGFEWGYPGSGPAQLAFALLLEHTQDPELSKQLYQRFKDYAIAPMKRGLGWTMGFGLVEGFIRKNT